MQSELDRLYLKYLNRILEEPEIRQGLKNNVLSCPQFLNVDTPRGNYMLSKFKILFVGQETYGWVTGKEEKEDIGLPDPIANKQGYIETLKKTYYDFNLGMDYFNSPIYQFMYSIVDNDKIGFLMTNSIRHDGRALGSNRVPSSLEEIITHNSSEILREEISILDPDAIIFLTGPRYDDLLRKTFSGLNYDKYKTLSQNELSVLSHSRLKAKVVRIYHPNYHNYKGSGYMEEISNTVKEVIFSNHVGLMA